VLLSGKAPTNEHIFLQMPLKNFQSLSEIVVWRGSLPFLKGMKNRHVNEYKQKLGVQAKIEYGCECRRVATALAQVYARADPGQAKE
jgi:hypothetical protein